jgi:hypothetical protein
VKKQPIIIFFVLIISTLFVLSANTTNVTINNKTINVTASVPVSTSVTLTGNILIDGVRGKDVPVKLLIAGKEKVYTISSPYVITTNIEPNQTIDVFLYDIPITTINIDDSHIIHKNLTLDDSQKLVSGSACTYNEACKSGLCDGVCAEETTIIINPGGIVNNTPANTSQTGTSSSSSKTTMIVVVIIVVVVGILVALSSKRKPSEPVVPQEIPPEHMDEDGYVKIDEQPEEEVNNESSQEENQENKA